MVRFRMVVRRELRLALRQGSDGILVVAFFVLSAILFPFGIGPEPDVLARIAAGVIWVTALLAALLSLDRLFQADYEDGGLDLFVLAPLPLELLVLAKCLGHWLLTGVPLLLAAPLVAVLLNLPPAALPALLLAMALGTPSLSLVGAVGAALVLGARRGGVLVSLLVLPLYIPVLIFGVACVEAVMTGPAATSGIIAWGDARPHFLLLSAFLAAALPLCPLAAAAALRQSVE